MSKKALAFAKADLALPEFFSGVFSEKDYQNLRIGRNLPIIHPFFLPVQLLDRPACETDFDHLQIIPYVAIRTRTQGMTLIASYQRGKGGAEGRLHDKYSIGFGGHVDSLPPAGESLSHHLANECARELQEELGLEVRHERMHRLVSNCCYLYIQDAEQDKVHLGLLLVLDVSESTVLKSLEEDQISNLAWTNVQDLREQAAAGRLENWSRIMVEEELV